eukprot:5695395-Prymnesium_polylepis.1
MAQAATPISTARKTPSTTLPSLMRLPIGGEGGGGDGGGSNCITGVSSPVEKTKRPTVCQVPALQPLCIVSSFVQLPTSTMIPHTPSHALEVYCVNQYVAKSVPRHNGSFVPRLLRLNNVVDRMRERIDCIVCKRLVQIRLLWIVRRTGEWGARVAVWPTAPQVGARRLIIIVCFPAAQSQWIPNWRQVLSAGKYSRRCHPHKVRVVVAIHIDNGLRVRRRRQHRNVAVDSKLRRRSCGGAARRSNDGIDPNTLECLRDQALRPPHTLKEITFGVAICKFDAYAREKRIFDAISL